MDPKELRKLFDEKKAETDSAAASVKAEGDAYRAGVAQRFEGAERALEEVALPCLREIEAALPPGEFETQAVTNPAGKITGLWFRAGKGGRRYGMQASLVGLEAYVVAELDPGMGSKRKAEEAALKVIFPFSEPPFIGGKTELTKAKVERLVEIAIKGETPKSSGTRPDTRA